MRSLFAVALCLSLGCATSTRSLQMDRGPWLQQVRADGAIVVWQSRAPSDGRVEFGLSPDLLDRVAGDELPGRRHEVRLEGLPPDSTIYYRLRSQLAEGQFRTAPLESGSLTRIWVLGDSGQKGTAQQAVRDAMRRHLADQPLHLFLHVGDIAYPNGTEEELQAYFFDVYPEELRNVPFWPAFGNHESRSTDPEQETGPWFDAFVLPKSGESGGLPSGREAYYAFDWGDIHFVFLDSTHASRAPDGRMLDWLRADLAASEARWKIAVFHHPPYTKGSLDSDRSPTSIEMRENAVPILEAGGVDLVLAGHAHGYERSALIHGAYETPSIREGKIVDGESPFEKADSGAVYVVAGHGGASLGGRFGHPLMEVGEAIHGSMLMEIEGDTLRAINVRADGSIGDSFVIRKMSSDGEPAAEDQGQ